MRKITLALFIAALTIIGVANQVSAQTPAATGTTITVTPPGGPPVVIPPGSSATVTITLPLPAAEKKAKKITKAPATPATAEVVTATGLATAITQAKAYTDQAAAAVALPMFTRTRPGEILSEQMLAQVICPADKMVRGSDGTYTCTAERTELYSPAAMLEAVENRVDSLSKAVVSVRQSAVLQPTRQPYELMLGAGATGVMDLGGALVAVGDMVWGSDRWPLGLVLHGEVGDMSDGQGLFGCAAVGVAKPMPGTSTTVGLLGGWCGSDNADLDGTNFWHGDVQVRHRVLKDWLVVGLDLKGGALWREKVVDQSVREVRDPAFGALGSIAVNLF